MWVFLDIQFLQSLNVILGWFATKIFHPNVGSDGEICVNTLKKDWKPEYGIGHILVTVKCLLIYPNPESALDEEAGKLLLEEYSSYCDRAKLITSIHATPRVKPVEFNTPSAPQPDESIASSSTNKEPSPSGSASETTSATLKVDITPPSSSALPPPPALISIPLRLSSSLAVPTVTRKASSPSPKTSEKEGLGTGPQKERHTSPSPLATADSNVGSGKPSMGVGMGMASTAGMGGITGTKAVKRAATGSAPTNAEKRKKALKRL